MANKIAFFFGKLLCYLQFFYSYNFLREGVIIQIIFITKVILQNMLKIKKYDAIFF